MIRILKWTVVGGIGMLVKLGAAVAARELLGFHYMLATVAAVEATLLHNFCWHQWWTWRDRSAGVTLRMTMSRLLRFHASTGLLAFAFNIVLVRALVETFSIHYLAANLISMPLAGIANFLASEFLVFVGPREAA